MPLPAWAVYAIITLVSTGLSILLAPKPPKPQDANQQALDESSVPVAQEGHPIPVIFGRVQIQSPNILWYGRQATIPIVEDVGGGKK